MVASSSTLPHPPEAHYRFRWTCAGAGFVEYEVTGDGTPYCVEVQRGGPYYRPIFAGTEEDWQRDVVPAIGILRRVYRLWEAVPQPVVEAFNAWRDAEYDREMSNLARWCGGRVPADPWIERPTPVRGGKYVPECGWVATD